MSVTWAEHFADKSTDHLEAEALALHSLIFNEDCFGVHDLVEYDAILTELEHRGVSVSETKNLTFEMEDRQ